MVRPGLCLRITEAGKDLHNQSPAFGWVPPQYWSFDLKKKKSALDCAKDLVSLECFLCCSIRIRKGKTVWWLVPKMPGILWKSVCWVFQILDSLARELIFVSAGMAKNCVLWCPCCHFVVHIWYFHCWGISWLSAVKWRAFLSGFFPPLGLTLLSLSSCKQTDWK